MKLNIIAVLLIIFALLYLCFLIVATSTKRNSFVLNIHAPAQHTSILASQSFESPISYGSGNLIDCSSAGHEISGRCLFKMKAPNGAKSVQLLVKAKAWIPKAGANNTCQLDASVNTGDVNNHFIHVEEWGDDTGQRRRVTHSTITTSVIDGMIEMLVNHGITGTCVNEIVVYLEGWYE